jgi:Ca2+-binding RTX toxin-like protein
MLSGGNGNDTFYVDRSDDVIVDSSGLDRVSTSANFTLGSSLEQLFLSGTSAIDGTGNGLANTLYGNAAANKLSGLAGNDFISAGAGHDTILGGAGNDRLSGGAGFDRFVFNTALSATTNVDRISDYSAADDTFAVAKSVFSAFASLGTLHAGQFYKGTSAHDADDRIIYNATNGALIYDSNGNTAGGATMFAILATGLTLTHADFTII